MSGEIHCPKCGSTQLTTEQRGYSAGKAAAGVILTGGIGLLAGAIGNSKVVITCLACGKQFKPGEGKLEGQLQSKELNDGEKNEALRLYAEKGWPAAATYIKKQKQLGIVEARAYIERFAKENNVISGKPTVSSNESKAILIGFILLIAVVLYFIIH